MKKIIVIPVIFVILVGLIVFYNSKQTGYIKIEAPGFETDLNLSSRWGSKTIKNQRTMVVNSLPQGAMGKAGDN